MAEHALVSAGEMPHLLSHAARAGAVSDRIGAVHAKRVHQCRVRLLIIPDIGVADPRSFCLTTMRVSIRFLDAGLPSSISSENDFTVTAPSSNSHALSSWKVIFPSPGRAKKRSLCAPSDQNGALISYGMTP